MPIPLQMQSDCEVEGGGFLMPAVELLRERLVETAEGREKNTGGTDVKYEWMDNYLMKKAGVTRDLQEDWNWIRYQIDGKMFAAICMDENDRPYYITLKLEPMEGDFWRGQYEDVIPGYYMNKTHWNSIRADGAVPDDIVKDMLDHSYRLVLNKLSRKRQKEIVLVGNLGPRDIFRTTSLL